MRRFLVTRLLMFIPVLFGVSVLIFVLLRVMPGDAAALILAGPEGGVVDPAQWRELREKMGLDRPLLVQYGTWIWSVLRLDGGASLVTQRPVFDIVRAKLPLTLEMALLSTLISVAIGVPSGIVSAVRQNTWVDYVVRVISISGLAMPSFLAGIVILFVLVFWFTWLPPVGYVGLFQDPLSNIKQVIFPSIALGYAMAAIVARMTRATMLEVLRQDYVRTAFSKGLGTTVIHLRHALRNAILPVFTIIAVQFAILIGGTVIQERLWNLPGLGRSLIEGIDSRDLPMVQGLVMVFASFVLVVNTAADILYRFFDPRIRYR